MIRLNKVAVRDALYTVSGAAPTATDDVSKGYLVGSRWIVGTTEYRCDVNLKDAAVWTVVGSGGGGGGSTAADITAEPNAELVGTTVQSQLTGIAARLAVMAVATSLFTGTLETPVINVYGVDQTSVIANITLEYI